MTAFQNFLLDKFPEFARQRKITSLLWWSWANSPDVGAITAGDKDPGTFNKVPSPLKDDACTYCYHPWQLDIRTCDLMHSASCM